MITGTLRRVDIRRTLTICLPSSPTLDSDTLTHSHRIKGEGIWKDTLGVGRGGAVIMYMQGHLTFGGFLTLRFTFLPPGLGENNEGTSAAFEGGLDGAHGHSLRGVSGQLAVSPQLLKQLSVEGGRLGLACYLRPEGPGARGGAGVLLSITRTLSLLHAE